MLTAGVSSRRAATCGSPRPSRRVGPGTERRQRHPEEDQHVGKQPGLTCQDPTQVAQARASLRGAQSETVGLVVAGRYPDAPAHQVDDRPGRGVPRPPTPRRRAFGAVNASEATRSSLSTRGTAETRACPASDRAKAPRPKRPAAPAAAAPRPRSTTEPTRCSRPWGSPAAALSRARVLDQWRHERRDRGALDLHVGIEVQPGEYRGRLVADAYGLCLGRLGDLDHSNRRITARATSAVSSVHPLHTTRISREVHRLAGTGGSCPGSRPRCVPG